MSKNINLLITREALFLSLQSTILFLFYCQYMKEVNRALEIDTDRRMVLGAVGTALAGGLGGCSGSDEGRAWLAARDRLRRDGGEDGQGRHRKEKKH